MLIIFVWVVAPRGHDNPSITASEGMSSEGVGSYWPFATGKMVNQANLLLEQILNTPETKYVLIPNQNNGAYQVGFNPQWIAREYLARKGGTTFRDDQITESRFSLLGYTLNRLRVDGHKIPKGLLQTNYQNGVGDETYDIGAQILTDFFAKELAKYDTEDLRPIGREIINCFKNGGSVKDYEQIIK